MILIRNTQRKIKINIKEITSNIKKMLVVIDYSDFDIGVWFTTNKTIRSYNKKYRKKDSATDILSFPYHPNLKPGKRVKILHSEDKNLGDIIISLEFVKKCVEIKKCSFNEYLKILLAHGVAHLLGYDHQLEKDFVVMKKIEQQLLAAL
jgi:rRNA maturation RNase YbeY